MKLESFSPTDLIYKLWEVAFNHYGYRCRKKVSKLKGLPSVKKTMRSNPRMIDQIDVVIILVDFEEKLKCSERAAHNVQYIGYFQ